MSLKFEFEGGVKPFDWEYFTCPLCGSNKFTSLDHAGVFCDECCAAFSVRQTAGDPGCVVDCHVKKEQRAYVYAPAYICEKCEERDRYGDFKHARFDWQDKACPHNSTHGQMTREPGLIRSWTPPKGLAGFYLILKLGDYCSGWLKSSEGKTIGEYRDHPLKGPTQEQWMAYQEIKPAPEFLSGPRFLMVGNHELGKDAK